MRSCLLHRCLPVARPAARRLSGAFLALLATLVLTAATSTSAAPSLVSVTPAKGATGVALDSTLVFTFSEAMAELTPIGSVAPFFIGNFDTTPGGLTDSLNCEWSADVKTMTCSSSDPFPASTTISWTLNPAGTSAPFTSAAGTALPTTTGSFTTAADTGGGGGGVPKLVSATPASGATGVSVGSTVVFVFDQAMLPLPNLGGFPPFLKGAVAWTGTGLTATKFSYAWSAVNTTLTCTYSGNLPANTTLGWTLNPDDAGLQIMNQDNELLAKISGSFTTGADTGGNPGGCEQNTTPDGWGAYSISKMAQYAQTSTADPTPSGSSPFSFGSFVQAPAAGPAVTSASLTFPGGTKVPLEGIFGMYFLADDTNNLAAFDAKYPSGAYTLRFQRTGEAERAIAMNLPASAPPVPKIQNYTEAQAIAPATDFTLRWNAFTGAVATDYISLTITEGTNVVFQAPDLCVPRTLANTATSIVIPANTLKTGKLYQGTLTFNRWFYNSTNTVPNMTGFGAYSRMTEFSLNTGSSTPAAAAKFLTWTVLANGHPQMTFQGTSGKAYTVQRTTPVFPSSTWTPAGSATPNAAGIATFEDPTPAAFPLIYRAVAP